MGIRNGEVFEQSFVVEENILNGIEIMCLVGGDAENTELTYELVEAEGNEVVRSGEIDTKEIVSGKFYRISFDKIEDCKDKKYMFSMRQKISQENSGIAFYYAPNVEKNTRLKIDGQTVDGTTVMRGISHRFDLETFIVLLSFILYIILFMKFLIKLFK